MRDEELFRKAQKGDKASFGEWCRNQGSNIGQFGYQNGVPPGKLAEYQETVYRKFGKWLQKIEIEQAERKLYEQAIAVLISYNETPSADGTEKLLHFEEDLETHHVIQELPENNRLVFTLFYFHRKNEEEIARLTGRLLEEIGDELAKALEFLADALTLENSEQINKRIEFVGKSYKRIQVQHQEGDLFNEELEEVPETKHRDLEQKPVLNRKVAALLAIASLFLIGIIGVSFVWNDENPKVTASADSDEKEEQSEVVTDKMVQDWVAEYTQIRETSPQRLGVEQEVYEELQYVKEADEMMKIAFSDETLEQVRNDPENMQQIVDNLFRQIETPRGMEQFLYKSPLLAEDLNAFFDSYALKTKELMELANDVLHQHQEELAGAAKSGELIPENLLADRDEYPQEVERLIGSIDEQMLTVAVHPTETRFIVRRNIEPLYGHSSLMGDDGFGNTYLYALANEPYYDQSGLLMPVEMAAYHLGTMEMLLTEEDETSAIFKDYYDFLQNSFWMVLKGTENDPVFDSEGVVHEHYQRAWKSLVQYSSNTLIYAMLPIVEEMEASNWTESVHYDQLAYQDIMAVLQMERSGQLAEMLPNADLANFENELVEMDGLDYSRVEGLYTAFAKSHDPTVIEGSSPTDIFLLYYYANSQKDAETMWHLLADDELKPDLKIYKSEWQQLPDIKEELQWIEVTTDSMFRVGRDLQLQFQYSSHSMEMIHAQPPVMVTSDHHVWLLKNRISENYTSVEEKAAYFKKAEQLYDVLSSVDYGQALAEAKPGVIGAAYLLAAEQKNYTVMKKLTVQPERKPLDGEFEASAEERIYPILSEEEGYSFTSEYYQTMEGEVQGTFYVTVGAQDSASFSQEGFSMAKTAEGWKMTDLYFY